MGAMNFKQLISELEDSQLTHQEIGELCDSGKSNISQIKTRGTVPNYFLGEKLIKLHATRCPDSELLKSQGR